MPYLIGASGASNRGIWYRSGHLNRADGGERVEDHHPQHPGHEGVGFRGRV